MKSLRVIGGQESIYFSEKVLKIGQNLKFDFFKFKSENQKVLGFSFSAIRL